ncbi:MAG: hypothetical protein NWE86_03080 [Candidatus Bathyarchaeota archaeon]|nr:hypothetical protein [Candidatus Bathyarchaeota archaeon]
MAIESVIIDAWSIFMDLLPKIAGAIIVLIIGWIAGRIIGKGASSVLDKIGIDDALLKTAFGKAIEKSGMTVVKFFDMIIRWFIYLIALFAATDILEISVLSEFMRSIVSYLPSFIAGVFVLIFGFIASDFVGDTIESIGKEAKIEFSGMLSNLLKLLLYFIVLTVGLGMMKIDIKILYIFAEALAWGGAIGIGAGLGIAFGWGLKDFVAKNANKWFTDIEKSAKSFEKTKKPKK